MLISLVLSLSDEIECSFLVNAPYSQQKRIRKHVFAIFINFLISAVPNAARTALFSKIQFKVRRLLEGGANWRAALIGEFQSGSWEVATKVFKSNIRSRWKLIKQGENYNNKSAIKSIFESNHQIWFLKHEDVILKTSIRDHKQLEIRVNNFEIKSPSYYVITWLGKNCINSMFPARRRKKFWAGRKLRVNNSRFL